MNYRIIMQRERIQTNKIFYLISFCIIFYKMQTTYSGKNISVFTLRLGRTGERVYKGA